MKTINSFLIILLLVSFNAMAQEFAYVTDSLQLRVFVSPSESSEVLQSIESGDSVEVFETQEGFSKVSTFDGTVGWVKSAFLVVEPPPKLLYYSVSEKNKQLEEEIEALQTSVSTESIPVTTNIDETKLTELQTQLAQQKEINQGLQQKLDESKQAQTENSISVVEDDIVGTQVNPKSLSPTQYVTLGLALLGGLLLGLKISSWRMEKRFHGFRF